MQYEHLIEIKIIFLITLPYVACIGVVQSVFWMFFFININAYRSSSACMSILSMLLTIHFLFPTTLRNLMTHMVDKKAIYCTINNPWLF